MKGTKVYLTPGVPVPVIGCYSEAFCHGGYAGKPVSVQLVANTYDGRTHYSGAVVRPDGYVMTGFTTGECGIRQDEGGYYTEQRNPDDTGDANPKALQAEMTALIRNALRV